MGKKVAEGLPRRLTVRNMDRRFGLENEADPQGRRNEQVARSEAECQRFNALQDFCL